jgi:hypothetical protein
MLVGRFETTNGALKVRTKKGHRKGAFFYGRIFRCETWGSGAGVVNAMDAFCEVAVMKL